MSGIELNGTHSDERTRLVARSWSQSGTSPKQSFFAASLEKLKYAKLSKDQWLLGSFVVLLMIGTASERVTFKMAVDRMQPYRLILVGLILVISLFVFSVITCIKRCTRTNRISSQMKEFPHTKLILMALLDTIQFGGLVVSAAGVSPTMTVILLHTSTPCIVLGSRLTFPNRKYSSMQMIGIGLIGLAILISLTHPVLQWYLSGYPNATICSLLYVLFSALQGLTTLYKEKTIIEWSQPMDIHYLSSWLFYYQCIMAAILYPIVYAIQEYVTNYGKSDHHLHMWEHIKEGLECLFGDLDVGSDGSSVPEGCRHCLWLVLGYVFSTVLVLECIDRVIQISNQVLGRAMAAAVLCAFLALGFYDVAEDDGYSLFGTNIGVADICSIVVLIAGMEVYGRDPEPDAENITNFSPSGRV